MSVYVDDYKGRLGRMVMCHMMSDSIDELRDFANRLGLRREWFQESPAPHYDVCKSRRKQAISLGAIDLPIRLNGKANPEWRRVYGIAKSLFISWFCERCKVEVHSTRCKHCGKSKTESR